MASTTNNLGLYKPEDGETGWGNAVAENFDTVDQAIFDLDVATEKTEDKGRPGGYASLDGNGLVPVEQIPGGAGSQGDPGPTGPTGPAGSTGPQGDPGVGVPSGGSTGQVLAKSSNADYATNWVAVSGGGGGGVSQSAVDSSIETHRADTTDVHGIVNTANLVLTDDSRLTNARTPTAHKATHATGGSDVLTPADIGALATTARNAANGVAPLNASSIVPAANLGTGTTDSTTVLYGDGTFKTAPVGGGGGVTQAQAIAFAIALG